MSVPKCITDPAWEPNHGRLISLMDCKPTIDGGMDLPHVISRHANEDAELFSLFLESWDSLPIIVSSPEEQQRIAANLTPEELERIDWLNEWPSSQQTRRTD